MNDEAIAHYKAVIETFPDGAYADSAAFRVAGLAYNEKNYKESALHFGFAAEMAKNEKLGNEARYYQARSLELSEQTAAAIKAYETLAAKSKESGFAVRAAVWLGNEALARNDFGRALGYFEFVAAFDWSADDKFLVRAMPAKDMEAARREAQFQMAVCLRALGRSEEAAELMQGLIESSNEDGWKTKAGEMLKNWEN